MVCSLDDYARGFYGDKEYTIREGLAAGKGQLLRENSWRTNFKNVYYYREGAVRMKVNGNQARAYAKANGIEIKEDK